jgi:ATP-dependent RNA helicase DDX46/PRP5
MALHKSVVSTMYHQPQQQLPPPILQLLQQTLWRAEAARLVEVQKRREKLAAWKEAQSQLRKKTEESAASTVDINVDTNNNEADAEQATNAADERERRRVAIGDDALESMADNDDDDDDDDEADAHEVAARADFKPMRIHKADADDESEASFTAKTSKKRDRDASSSNDAARARAAKLPALQAAPTAVAAADDEIDPLDAFMVGVHKEVRAINTGDADRAAAAASNGGKSAMTRSSSRGDILVDNANREADPADNDDDGEFDWLNYGKEEAAEPDGNGKSLPVVDHSKIDYEPLEKTFYIESPEIKAMSEDEVAAFRLNELENTVVRGDKRKDAAPCPRPVKKFAQCGLSAKLFGRLAELQFETPTPIQAQAMPAIMSGRDVIGIAATGSGKTLAFLLPMFRHLLAQRPLAFGEGPIGLVLCPTRELCLQTADEAKKFKKALGIRTVPIYGGGPLVTQIAQLKRGAEIVVATPGRMIDVLCLNGGRVTNLTRVTMVVLDEADRMFDMGFQPQIERILRNVRPDHQTAMFTATFPRTIEASARKFLQMPIEITVGGRTRVPPNIEQHVEVLNDVQRFARLLQLISAQAQTKSATTLVFVERKEAADQLKARLAISNVKCQALHSSVPQEERDFTLDDFKRGELAVLVATSVAARGLDVDHLNLVINYDVPKHLESYVQRCGRTGRAGRKGVAYTFIRPEEARFAPELVRALKDSKVAPPAELLALAQQYLERCAAGEAVVHKGSDYGGKGYTFTAAEKARMQKERKKDLGDDDDDDDDVELDEDGVPVPRPAAAAAGDGEDEGITDQERKEAQAQAEVAEALKEMRAMEAAQKKIAELGKPTAPGGGASATTVPMPVPAVTGPPVSDDVAASRAAAMAALARIRANATATTAATAVLPPLPGATPTAVLPPLPVPGAAASATAQHPPPTTINTSKAAAASEAAQRAALFAQTLNMKASAMAVHRAQLQAGGPTTIDFEVNDYIQHARWRVTQRETLLAISERYNVGITARGTYIPSTRQPAAGERKLHLFIEGMSLQDVENAKAELQRVAEEATQSARPEGRSYGKYQV